MRYYVLTPLFLLMSNGYSPAIHLISADIFSAVEQARRKCGFQDIVPHQVAGSASSQQVSLGMAGWQIRLARC